jgi:hypothetical protein
MDWLAALLQRDPRLSARYRRDRHRQLPPRDFEALSSGASYGIERTDDDEQ